MRVAALLLAVPSVLAFDYTVGVGKDETTGQLGMGFDPSSIRPQPGDRVIFEYRAGSHSSIESTFTDPCIPKPGGYNSGVITVAEGTPVDSKGLPTTEYIVKDNNPVWFFDQAAGLCTQGGVFSINPELTNGGQTAGQFRANAEASDPTTASVAPTSASAAPKASDTASSTPTSSAASATQTPSTNSATMAGISMGATLVALGACLFI
ncbi:hypothetical protein RSOLAG22IIIB_06963 [Rhizoctonia solani]|uniref:Phytocyanin domain-containing protein n=1 Tax=Rhizoctonia solani TaxID=456999 RepID=A0A0K6GIK3_9AGAM|nr:unnamed protein product [Rhizoctonia solani]CUA78266.1 hypothetical protein RSOLAG22IIIB_06963 [Rhizoctonia solani]